MSNADTSDVRSPAQVEDWHDGMVESLVTHRTIVRTATRDGTDPGLRFLLMTEREVDDYFIRQRSNLDRLASLDLVAAGEAAIRLDYVRRVRGRHKDPLSRAYRDFHKKLRGRAKDRPPFDGDNRKPGVLQVLRGFTDDADRRLVGEYRECLIVRHWVAHGRYWDEPPVLSSLPVFEVRRCVEALLNALPA